jgi:hypothetical protein
MSCLGNREKGTTFDNLEVDKNLINMYVTRTQGIGPTVGLPEKN